MMQTFVPYSNDYLTAQCLDNKRLLKQIVECLQISKALCDPSYGWQNHPAVKMWRGYGGRLAIYTDAMQREYVLRYKKRVNVSLPEMTDKDCDPPWWNGPIHASHRSNLLRKLPAHYSQFRWKDDPNEPYVWPV